MKSTKYRSKFIFCCVMMILLIIGIIMIPLVMRKKVRASKQELAKPSSDNTDLWAQFPGKLNTSLNHSFTFFKYIFNSTTNDTEKKLSLMTKKAVFQEEIKYTNFSYDDKSDQISFIANKTFKQIEGVNETILLPSLGMFETLNTLTNPPLYQQGINGVKYLMLKMFGDKNIFVKKLFTAYAGKTILYNKDRVMKTILRNIPESKKESVYNNEDYGFRVISSFFKWIEVLNENDYYAKNSWIKNTLKLTEEEANTIVGKGTYLDIYLEAFGKKLLHDYNIKTLEELIYIQLSDNRPTEEVGFSSVTNLNNYVYNDINSNSSLSGEMKEYWEDFKKKHNITDKEYSSFQLDTEELSKVFSENSASIVTEPNNAIKLLTMNKTSDSLTAYNLYAIGTIEKLNFLTDYIFEYLPSFYIYQEFSNGEKGKFKISPLARGYTSFLQMIVDETYGHLASNGNLYSIVLAKVTEGLLESISGKENLCPILLQRALNSGKKVLKICSDESLKMQTYESIKAWAKPYKCIKNPEMKCDKTVIDRIKSLAKISDVDIENIYSDDSLGKYFKEADELIKKQYECKDECSNEEFAKIQYTTGNITNNPPKIIESKKTKTISDWDKEEFPNPIEIFSYQQEMKCPEEDCNGESNEVFLALFNTTNTILQNEEAFEKRALLEKMFTLLLNGTTESQYGTDAHVKNSSNFFGVFNALMKNDLFNNTLLTSYENEKSILNGNSKEDLGYLKLLGNGNFYENFKPNKSLTTGFNLLQKTENEEEDLSKFDQFTIYTTQNDKTKILRNIFNINGIPILNTKKLEYSSKEGKFIPINANLYDNYNISNTTSVWFNDGFQYDSENHEIIYFYDELSSRVFKFKYTNSRTQGSTNCYEYVMITDDLTLGMSEAGEDSKIPFVSQKFDKPFVVTPISTDLTSDYELDLDSETLKSKSYICVDELSDMVLESNITLKYSISTKDLNSINVLLKKNDTYPLLVYNRYFKVDKESYNKVFSGVSLYFTGKMVVIILGVILFVITLALGIFFLIKHNKAEEEINENNLNGDNVDRLIPDESKA